MPLIFERFRKLDATSFWGAKEDDHKFLHEWFLTAEESDVSKLTEVQGHYNRRYRFMNNVPLNDSNFDLKFNVLLLDEEELLYVTERGKQTRKKLSKTRWVWITDYALSTETVRTIAKGGRARWKVENETFNTLKNQGCHFEHNYGHGYKNLSNVLAGIMLLVFLFDQILLACNKEMQQAFAKVSSRHGYLWQKILSLFDEWRIGSLESVYRAVFQPPPKTRLIGSV